MSAGEGQREGYATYLAEPGPRAFGTPASALAFGAHPDDIEFGAGATLARWAASGADIRLAIFTDGRRGTWDPEVDPLELALARSREAEASAEVIGATSPPTLLGETDGELATSTGLVMRVVALIRGVRPEAVITHDPWKRYRIHPDHRIAGEVVVDALSKARDCTFWPELGPAWRPAALLLFEAEEVDLLQPMDGFVAVKARALAEHRSQYRSSYGIASDVEPVAHLVARLLAASPSQKGEAPSEGFKLVTDL